MPDSGQPTNPNFIPGVGRLVTDRFDFQNHVIGENFRHNADAIDVIPNITVNSQSYSNVLTALEALAANIVPPSINPATSSTPGLIQLIRDLGGSNGLTPIVIGLQGRPVSPQVPSAGNTLTWNGSAWAPAATSGLFSPGADLGGSNPASSSSLQYVSSLTGNNGIVTIPATTLNFTSNTNTTIGWSSTVTGLGANLNVSAQGSTTSTGGSVNISGGSASGGQLAGSTIVNVNSSIVLEATQVISGNNVLALCTNTALHSSDMPANTGNNVIYIRNAQTNPSTGVPVNGAILYGNNGQLWIKQADGNNFQIGSNQDPNVWTAITGSSIPFITLPINGFITYNATQNTGTNTSSVAFSFTIPPSAAIKMDATYIGKEIGSGNVGQYEAVYRFVRNGSSAPTGIGSITVTDLSNASGNFSGPSLSYPSYISGNNIILFTGASSATSSNWTIIARIYITTAV